MRQSLYIADWCSAIEFVFHMIFLFREYCALLNQSSIYVDEGISIHNPKGDKWVRFGDAVINGLYAVYISDTTNYVYGQINGEYSRRQLLHLIQGSGKTLKIPMPLFHLKYI